MDDVPGQAGRPHVCPGSVIKKSEFTRTTLTSEKTATVTVAASFFRLFLFRISQFFCCETGIVVNSFR